jgi:Fe-S-cluster containining protein
MTFACSQCGACCRGAAEAGLVPTRDGHCIHLTPDHRCAIYATRPTVCNVAATHAGLVSQGSPVSQAQYFTLSAVACNQLMDRYDVAASFRVDPSVYLAEEASSCHTKGGLNGP